MTTSTRWLWLFFGLSVTTQVVATSYSFVGERGILRSGPGGGYGTVATIESGEILNAIGRQGNWLQVKTRTLKSGWVFRGLAQPLETKSSNADGAHKLIDEWVGDYWLFVIGVDKYQHWPALENAVRDARETVEVLTQSYGFDPARVIALYDNQATEENIFREFLRLKNQLKPNDSLLIYYAGHGVLDEFDTASWVPVDARRDAISDLVATDRINRILGKLRARHVFLVADACYSGSLFNTRGSAARAPLIDDRYFRENVRRYSRQALTSGGTEPVTDGGGRNGNSIFAHHFLTELRNETAPYLAASSLSLRVQELVARNSSQEPRWDHLIGTGDEKGEFFFLRNPDATLSTNDSFPEVTTHLSIHTYPVGAKLKVNGEDVGVAPLTLTGLAGTVSVDATLDGHRSATESVRLRYDREQLLVLKLNPIAGSGALSITTQPVGAQWYLDGAYMGTTPDRATDILAGTHLLSVRKDGYPSWSQTIRVSQDQSVSVDLDLIADQNAQVGSLEIVPVSQVAPDNASIMSAAKDNVAKVTRATAVSLDQRQALGIDRLEKILGDFVGAYQLQDKDHLKRVSELSVSRGKFVDKLFKRYKDIDLRLVSLEVTDQDATAALQIVRLTKPNGDYVIPAENWRTSYLLVNRDGDLWSKIQWQ